jgi:hypothetical protein
VHTDAPGRVRTTAGLASVAALLACLVLAVATAPPAAAAQTGSAATSGAAKPACRASATLPNYFSVTKRRKVSGAVPCRVAKKVVKGFAKRCAGAYAAQGRCRVRAAGKWRCKSRLAGPADKGAPSRVKCRKRRAKLRFVIASFPPVDSQVIGFGPVKTPLSRAAPEQRAPLTPAWNASAGCIETGAAERAVPVPDLGTAGFEIRLVGALPISLGESLQQALLSNDVWQTLVTGLAARPRNQPARLPIILTGGKMPFGAFGVMETTCSNLAQDANLNTVNANAITRYRTGAHELYHAFSKGLSASAGTSSDDTWWEEASATWAEGKTGFGEEKLYDVMLQYPDTALDAFPEPDTFAYAMSRFVQFLDDRGLVTSGAFWDLQPPVIRGYSSVTQTLDQQLRARGTSLGYEAAAFWGDRLRANPAHGPGLAAAGPNSNIIEIKPGTTEIPATADRLHTKLYSFTLADNVARAEFVFEAPADGRFWGAVEQNRSEELTNKTVSFCVKRGDENDLEWPIRFPVTFTNGSLNPGEIEGKITIHAQRGDSQCGTPAPGNRACELLAGAGVSGLLGPGQFPFFSTSDDGQITYWLCFYVGSEGEVNFNLARFRGVPSSQVREAVRTQIAELRLRKVNVGDLAGIGTITDDQGVPADLMTIASGREIIFLILAPAGDQSRAITLGKRIVGQVD